MNKTEKNALVRDWFGQQFEQLAPELQSLHLNGGSLSGCVTVSYGKGLNGWLGRRIGRKLNIPQAGRHDYQVEIYHDAEGLHWNRLFNGHTQMDSTFKPVGTIENGYWLEQTGPLKVRLSVDIKQGGWYWRCLKISFFGIPLTGISMMKTTAYKTIEDGQYRFYVGFALPLMGELLSYSGRLTLKH